MEIKRIATKKLEKLLNITGAVLITGPKFCGKTFLAQLCCKSSIFLDDLDISDEIKLNREKIIEGEYPRLIDEWELIPNTWDWVRRQVDKDGSNYKDGLFILTGSSTPIDSDKVFHSGAGRISRLKLQTLTFAEIYNFEDDESISLYNLFDSKYKMSEIKNQINLKTVINQMILGGWPGLISKNLTESWDYVESYLNSVNKKEIKKQYQINFNSITYNSVFKSLCRLTTTQLNKSKIIEDLNGNINIKTLEKYLQIISDTCLSFDVNPWRGSNIRSSYVMRSKPKTYICDCSIIAYLLSVQSCDQLLKDLNTLGIIFENQVIKDLKVYAEAIDAQIYFYRDSDGNEIDAIIELKDGRWGAIEIKLSDELIQNKSDRLNKVIASLNMVGPNAVPSFKAIITNADRSYTLKDGTLVIPFPLLRP